ncbi:MAG: stage V sporulation protein AC [Clostridia bacterium]|nr:stage V sporulation protein AC [Clostridia bacterium]
MKNFSEKNYQKLVSQHEKSPWLKNIFWAFTVGGLICVLGEFILTYAKNMGLPKEDAGCVTSMTLIFFSGLFTGLGIFDKLAKHAGAGTIVPITGFANAVVSPAMEFKSEGFILGVGAKMFVVAGPVIVYGVSSSIICGLIYYLVKGGMPL